MANETTVFRSLVEQIQQRNGETATPDPVRPVRQRRDGRREEARAALETPTSTRAVDGFLSRRWL